MRIPALFVFLLAGAALIWGQTPAASPPEACTKNVSFAVAEGGQPVPAVPKFTSKWIDKKLPKQDYKGLCFSQIPSSSSSNYVVIFSTSEAMFEGLTPTAHTYTSAPGSANGSKTTSYGGTWSYAYAGVPPPKTTTTLDLQRDDKPKSLFARAYNQQGHLVSSYSLAGFPSRETLVEYILAAILGDRSSPTRQMPTAVPLSVYYVNCDVDSPQVQIAMGAPPSTTVPAEPSRREPPAPAPMPLEIWSTPAGADISLDGMTVGKTPHSLVVPAGQHMITLRKQDFATWERQVQVDADKRRVVAYLEQKSIVLKFPPALTPPEPSPKEYIRPASKDDKDKAAGGGPTLNFWSTPAGADIFVDGALVGKTPLSLAVAPGEHAVSLRKKDFGTWERKVVVDAGDRRVGANLPQKSLALQ